nr:TATA binding protein of transcription factor IID [Cryptomonas paramecium]
MNDVNFFKKNCIITQTIQHSSFKCNGCQNENIIEDKKQGELVCKDCGLVFASHIIDFNNEWRTFSSDQFKKDPSRIGSHSHPLIELNKSTGISKGLKGFNFLNERLIKSHNRTNIEKVNYFLNKIFVKNSLIIEKAFLPKFIKQKVEELFKLYFDHLTMRSDGSRTRNFLKKKETTSILAALILICCRNEGIPRTFREISEITKISKKEIGLKVRAIQRSLRGIHFIKTKNSESFVSRFCSKLGLPYFAGDLAEKLAKLVKEKEGLYGKTLISVATAAIYIITQLPFCNVKYTSKEISRIAGINENTLRITYKAVYPYKNEILKHLILNDDLNNTKTYITY